MGGKLRAVVVGWCGRRGAPSLSAGFGRAQPSKDRGVQALVADGVSGMRAMRPRARRNTLARACFHSGREQRPLYLPGSFDQPDAMCCPSGCRFHGCPGLPCGPSPLDGSAVGSKDASR